MKRIIAILALIAITATAYGQTYIYPTAKDYKGWLTTGTATGDTLTNSTTKTYVISLTGDKSNVAWQIDVVKVSGTLGGYIQWFGSATDTTYYTTPFHVDSMTNASANYGYYFDYNPFSKVKAVVTQSGTTVGKYRLGATWRSK